VADQASFGRVFFGILNMTDRPKQRHRFSPFVVARMMVVGCWLMVLLLTHSLIATLLTASASNNRSLPLLIHAIKPNSKFDFALIERLL
jgi:hypothetical protein